MHLINGELLQLLTPCTAEVFELNTEPKCDLKQHFKEFMSTTNKKDSSVARARLVYIGNDKVIVEEWYSNNILARIGNLTKSKETEPTTTTA